MSAGSLDMAIQHDMSTNSAGVRLHYVSAGKGARTVVLLHGFPQTWYAWRHAIPLLVTAGYRVVAPDYRGAGNSSHPLDGYDKQSMAGDIYHLVQHHLGITRPIVLVGHDIGLMIAYAYAQQFRKAVDRLVVIDAPLPGTRVFEKLRMDSRVWQFAFHGVRDIPEMLVAGRERAYLRAFIDARLYDPTAINDADLDVLVSAYAAPGAMRSGFELYRAFDRDIDDNRSSLERFGKLTIPVLAVGGEASTTGPLMADMMREVAERVSELRVPRTGHFIAEENPGFLVSNMLTFLEETTPMDGTA
jgi:pimeloyl-ACP methyl ester carboxylesterase